MRQSGKTYRALLQAVSLASEGHSVYLLSEARCEDYILHRLFDVTRCLEPHVISKFWYSDHRFTLNRPDGSELGSIVVMWVKDFERKVLEHALEGCPRDAKLVFDNCWISDQRVDGWIQYRLMGGK